jgi:hypothetical protein
VPALQSEQINELAAALVDFQYALVGAQKDSTNPFHRSKYADLESCIASIRDPLHANGLAITQTMRVGMDNITVLVTTLAHKSGQWIKSEMPLLISPRVNKDGQVIEPGPQEQGSAITYGRRYALSAITGLYQTDDDGEAAQGRSQAKKQEAPKAAAQSPYNKQTSTPNKQATVIQNKPAASAPQPSQPARTKSGPVEGEEPSDAEVVAEAAAAPPTGVVFKQMSDAGVSNGWTVEQVEAWTEKFLTDNSINTDLDSLNAIAGQMSWAMVEGAIKYLLANKPE